MQFPDFFEETPENGQINLHTEDVPMPEGIPDENRISEWISEMATEEGRPLGEINYIFCSDEYLLAMNKTYLDHDYYTDVITFPLQDGLVGGDIFISTDRVADNATELGVSAPRELLRVMIHGALHLAGYGDKKPEEEIIMRQKEDYYLMKLDH